MSRFTDAAAIWSVLPLLDAEIKTWGMTDHGSRERKLVDEIDTARANLRAEAIRLATWALREDSPPPSVNQLREDSAFRFVEGALGAVGWPRCTLSDVKALIHKSQPGLRDIGWHEDGPGICAIILRELNYEPLVPGVDGERYFMWRRK